MDSHGKHARWGQPPPDPALPCIWMTAGLVAYKLCDRGLECDGCPFDAAMRGCGVSAHPPEPVRRAASLTFPGDRSYHPSHTWVLDRGGGMARVGLDAFAARLLAGATAVIFPARDATLRQGHPAAWTSDGEQLIPVVAPVSGVVRAMNPRVREDPRVITCDPYGHGWLITVERAASPREERVLWSGERMRAKARAQLEEVGARVRRQLARAGAPAGETLADGGEIVADLRRLLGSSTHRRIVEVFLN